jgi:YesN/AraC family two-component response regulator
MPGNQNLDFLHQAVALQPDLKIIVLTGYPTVGTAQESIQLPVLAYLVKPPEMEALLGYLERGAANLHIQRALSLSRERTLGWLGDMVQLQQLLRRPTMASDQDSARSLLTAAVGNQMAQLLDMKEIFERSFTKGAVREFCTVAQCPRLAQYQEAVRETIQILEGTKTVFRSKELAQLRSRLETLNGLHGG